MQASIQLMHWLTSSYAHHKALDGLYEAAREGGDRLAENLLARESKGAKEAILARGGPFRNASAADTLRGVTDMHDELVAFRERLPDETAQSLMDDIIASFRSAMYLCGLE
jgi:DNA-binding ferritin-like protein